MSVKLAMVGRRELLIAAAGATISLAMGRALANERIAADTLGPPELPAGTLASAALHSLAGKDPLIKRSYRPPNYETPVGDLGERFTDNRKFFVRYHLLSIPEIDPVKWRLRVSGDAAEKPFEVGLDELRKQFEPVEVAAVCQCSGNRRGLSDPHVPGVQWGYGAMGNARWKGVRLRDLLAKVGLRKEALEIVFDGADSGVIPKTPDFVKSIPIWKATDENTLIAFEMNGEPLPRWNGFPARLVVPGWTATYWIKHVTSIEVIAKPYDGYWMKTAYRIPKGLFPIVDRFVSQESDSNTPITEMLVNSIVMAPADGAHFAPGVPVEVKGIAWDGGYGVTRVDVSMDEGRSWTDATLGADAGRFSWRPWSHRFTSRRHGRHVVMARATNRLGVTQMFQPLFNPAGYHHNAVQRISVVVD
jgi:DMSO/TMAO reductase YedYZ molybdopterin-dependent catalytic subunit